METLSITLLSLFLIFSTCSKNEKNNSDNMKTNFEISVNESFEVELDSNPTTGFAWKWANKESVSIVDSTGTEYIPNAPALTGSGGKEIWKFIGLKNGTDTIKLEYCRPWDTTSTANTKNITVKVR
jgi:inhibitor of cysteine peptidase